MDQHIPVNSKRGEVPLPEAGEGIFLRYDVDALERLEAAYGEDFINVILKGMSQCRVKVYQTVVACGIRSNTKNEKGGITLEREMPFGMSFEDLQERILDAFYMTIHGRSYAEQKAFEEQMMAERIDKMQSDPRIANFLSSRPPGEQDFEQG